MEKISSVRASGITFAPEAGTQRMRDVINKTSKAMILCARAGQRLRLEKIR